MTTRTTNHNSSEKVSRQDVYTRITARIVADLEQGMRTWAKPWSAEHAAGKITRPVRHNGRPYSGINILLLWGSSLEGGFCAPIWMTYRQALELGAHVRKGEHVSIHSQIPRGPDKGLALVRHQGDRLPFEVSGRQLSRSCSHRSPPCP